MAQTRAPDRAPDPIPSEAVEKALDQLDAVCAKAIEAAGRRDIDEQQAAIERLADVSTRLRAARDLLAYSREAREFCAEESAVFAATVASAVSKLAVEHGDEHGLEPDDLPADALSTFVRAALRDDRLRALGRAVAARGGRNDCPLDLVHELTRDAVREFVTKEFMPLIQDQAVVLRRLDYSETSQVLVLFTRDHGKVRAIA